MTKAAEGFAAECIAEVGVGMVAVTSGAAFVKDHVRVKVLWEANKGGVGGVNLRNETTIIDCSHLAAVLSRSAR
jgi:hypothetical protein